MTVEIDGTPLSHAGLTELVDVQVEEATSEADAATVSARLVPDERGEWTSVLDALITPRTPLTVELERGGAVYRFEGRSTEAAWEIAPDGASRMTVKAVDRTLDMDVEEKVVAWRGAADSGIAEAIFATHQIKADAEGTPEGPDPDVHVVIQRATDWAFLRSLAAKWGYEVYLEARNGQVFGRFGPVDALADPQAELAFGFGGQAKRIAADVRLVSGKEVTAARIPPLSDAVAEGGSGGRGGAQGLQSLGGQTSVLLAPDDVDGEIDPAKASEGLARKSAFALRLDAEVDSDKVGRLMRARRTVRVNGIGDTLSGVYLVDSVRHRVSGATHIQQLSLVRNAFSGAKGLLA